MNTAKYFDIKHFFIGRSVIYVDGMAGGGGGMYSEPNTIIKAAHVHADADPSEYIIHVLAPYWFSLSSYTIERLFHFSYLFLTALGILSSSFKAHAQ